MLTKLMPVVVSLWVLLFSTQVIAESFTDTVKRVVPSVCMVTIESVKEPTIADDKDQESVLPPNSEGPPSADEQQNPFDDFLKKDQSNQSNQSNHEQPGPELGPDPNAGSMGTCFIVSYKDKKFVITNQHVVGLIKDGISKVIFYGSFKSYPATIIGLDKIADIAVLEMSTTEGQRVIEDIKSLLWANSNNVQQGESVWAVGHPMSQAFTVTRGIVSYKGRRNNSTWQELIQSDVAINSGNSGGPLLNLAGEVIGVNSFIITPTVGAGQIGVNFSVTSNLAKRVVEQLVDTGVVKRAKMGLMFAPDFDRGLFVVIKLESGSPSEAADIQEKDFLIKINDITINIIDDIGRAFDLVSPGDEIEVTILRGDKLIVKVVKTVAIGPIDDAL
jgi:S1-C subfamily serine protease